MTKHKESQLLLQCVVVVVDDDDFAFVLMRRMGNKITT
jgi:hypothetical protein